MRRVRKFIIPVGLVAALAAVLIGHWDAEPRGVPPEWVTEQDIGQLTGRVQHLTSQAKQMEEPGSTVVQRTRTREMWFDKQGRHPTLIEEDGISTRAYDYNSRGELTGIRARNTDGLYTMREQFSYDPVKHLMIMRLYERHFVPGVSVWKQKISDFLRRRNLSTRSEFTLNVQNKIVGLSQYDPRGKLMRGFTNRLDAKGELIGVVRSEAWMSGPFKIDYVRDAKGNVIEEKSAYTPSGLPAQRDWTKSRYDYDREGNWVRKVDTSYEKGKWKVCQVTERQITYY